MRFSHFKLRYDDKYIYLDRRHTDQGYNPVNALRYDFTNPLVGDAWRSWWDNPKFSDHINVPRDIIEQFLHIYDEKNAAKKRGILNVSADLRSNLIILNVDRGTHINPIQYSVLDVETMIDFWNRTNYDIPAFVKNQMRACADFIKARKPNDPNGEFMLENTSDEDEQEEIIEREGLTAIDEILKEIIGSQTGKVTAFAPDGTIREYDSLEAAFAGEAKITGLRGHPSEADLTEHLMREEDNNENHLLNVEDRLARIEAYLGL